MALVPPTIAKEDHLRCTGITAKGQCVFEAEIPGGFCRMCSDQGKNNKKARLYQYLVERNKAIVDHPDKYTLKEEAGILRILLSTLLQKVESDPSEIMRRTPQISELITKIQLTVTAAIKCEKSMGNLMDRDQITKVAQLLIDVVAEQVQDQTIIANIAKRFEEVINANHVQDKLNA